MSKDYERLCETSQAMIHAVMSRLMLRRLAPCLTLLAQLLGGFAGEPDPLARSAPTVHGGRIEPAPSIRDFE
jgi:hypothetical protein